MLLLLLGILEQAQCNSRVSYLERSLSLTVLHLGAADLTQGELYKMLEYKSIKGSDGSTTFSFSSVLKEADVKNL